jgi:arylsulfatase A-like enzyme
MNTFLIFVIALAVILGGCGCSGQQGKNTPPNIIFLLTDDHRWDALGVMGNPVIKTPHLDRLAGEGILFTNAYVTTSICAVSRASILSGQYMARHGIDDFNTSFSAEALAQTYPALLKSAGYTIGFVGKYGVGNPEDQPVDLYDYWACDPKFQPDYEMTDSAGNYLHHTDKVGEDMLRFLDNYGAKGPFCLSVSFKAPHVQDTDPRQFIPHPRYLPLFASDSIAPPPSADPRYWESLPGFFRTEENIARVRWHMRFTNPAQYQESVRNYYRLLTGVDDVVGSMLEKLAELGLGDNTVIVFTGDNGFFLGEHGLAGKWYGYEESIRVPLILHFPALADSLKGCRSEIIALNIDIAPTLLHLAGIPVPERMQGIDLLAMIADAGLQRRDFFYEHTFMGSPGIPSQEGVVSPDMKYMNFVEHDYEQLFDLTRDPGETVNLAPDPDYADLLARMRQRCSGLKEAAR